MTTYLIPNSDMQVFSPADIEIARRNLNQPLLDEASAIRALIIQRDTGLSMSRGEISIVPFNGKPTVMINKQGYLAYASRQANYDGYESGVDVEDGEMVAWCRVYNKNISHPISVKIYQKEYAKRTPIWNEKPRYMLEKTAISLALRAAFPILNGTYTEDEIGDEAPVRIEPKPSDITVEPIKQKPVTAEPPKQEPAPIAEQPKTTPQPTVEPETPRDEPVVITCRTVTADAVNLRYLPIYQQQNLDMSVFADAYLGGDKYNLDMIEADYRQQKGLNPKPETTTEIKPAQDEPAPAAKKAEPKSKQTKPSATLSGDVCEKCGKKLLENEIITSQKFCDGHLFCEEHRLEYVRERMAAKKTSKKGGSQ